jgi:hypothetical protein
MQQNISTTSLSVSESVMDPMPWTPTPLFFYGTLMDPELLHSVLELSEPPQLLPGTMSGLKIMLWGIYPGLVRTEGEKVEGMVWILSPSNFFNLSPNLAVPQCLSTSETFRIGILCLFPPLFSA